MFFLSVGSWRSDVLEQRLLFKDAVSYHQLALSLARDGSFARDEGPLYQPEIFRTPIYPSFLALVYLSSGYKPFVALFLQLFTGSAICLLVYKLGRILFNEKTALAAALLTAIEPSGIYYSNVLLTDSLFTFFIAFFVLLLAKFFVTESKRWLAGSALLLGLSTLTRPASAYLFAFLAVLFLIHYRINLVRGILRYSIFVFIFIASVLPWMIRNHRVSGKFLISSVQERVIDWSLFHIRENLKTEKAGSLKNEPEQDEPYNQEDRWTKIKIANNHLVKSLRSDAGNFMNGTLRFFLTPSSSEYLRVLGLRYAQIAYEPLNRKPLDKLKYMISNKSNLELFISLSILGLLIFLYTTMCVGISAAKREGKGEILLLSLLVITYFWLASAPFTQDMRYRLPIMPYVILLAAYGIVHIQTVMSKRRRKTPTLNRSASQDLEA